MTELYPKGDEEVSGKSLEFDAAGLFVPRAVQAYRDGSHMSLEAAAESLSYPGHRIPKPTKKRPQDSPAKKPGADSDPTSQ